MVSPLDPKSKIRNLKMSNFSVIVVLENGTPGRLYGPYQNYDEAESWLLNVLKTDKTGQEPVQITAEVVKQIEMDGLYTFDSGAGVYIVQSESEDDDDGACEDDDDSDDDE